MRGGNTKLNYTMEDCPEGSKWVQIGEGYAVSDGGHIFSLFKGAVMHPGMGSNGRWGISIKKYGEPRRWTKGVHVIVCEAFHGPRPEGMDVSHLDGNKLNNSADNLAWETPRDNHARKKLHGTLDSGLQNSRTVLDEYKLDFIKAASRVGMTNVEIATVIGVSSITVSRVLSGKRYNDEKRSDK